MGWVKRLRIVGKAVWRGKELFVLRLCRLFMSDQQPNDAADRGERPGGEGIDDQFQAERAAVECVKPRFCRAAEAEAQDVGHDRHAQLDCPEKQQRAAGNRHKEVKVADVFAGNGYGVKRRFDVFPGEGQCAVDAEGAEVVVFDAFDDADRAPDDGDCQQQVRDAAAFAPGGVFARQHAVYPEKYYETDAGQQRPFEPGMEWQGEEFLRGWVFVEVFGGNVKQHHAEDDDNQAAHAAVVFRDAVFVFADLFDFVIWHGLVLLCFCGLFSVWQFQGDLQAAVAVFRLHAAAVLFGDLCDQRQAEAAVFFAI